MNNHVHGGDVYHYRDCLDFSANCNPLGTPESVKAAARDSLERIYEYPQVGYQPLKEAIGKYEQVDPDWIICGNGAAEVIFSVCRAGKPKKALVTGPSFAEYEQALQGVGCEVDHFWLEEEEDFRVKRDFLKALRPELDIVFLCNPNNPTGVLMDQCLLMEILKRCRELDIFLVVDECFLDFVEEPTLYTLKKVLGDYRNLFIIKAFTKRYAMPGLRLGYGLCANTRLLEKMTEENQPWNISTPAQAAGMAALLENSYVEAGRQLVFKEKAYLRERLTRLGLKVYPSMANYLFFKGPEDLFQACLQKKVLIRDCSNYPGLSKGYYRIAVKKHVQNEILVKALEEIWQKRL